MDALDPEMCRQDYVLWVGQLRMRCRKSIFPASAVEMLQQQLLRRDQSVS